MKGKSKHILKRNLIMICSGLFLIVGLTGLIFSLTKTKPLTEQEYKGNTNSYITTQSTISSATLPSNTDVTMTEAITNAMATDYQANDIYITISSPKELYEFSYYCNDSSTKNFYLKQNYKLLCNIDYSESYYVNSVETTASPFIPIAWDSTGSAFTGTFDGQGYEISNLSFIKLADVAGSSTSVASTYANMNYLGMFSNNAGTIQNLGLNQSTLTISVTISKLSTTGGIANLVGYNSGTVTNCFYKDLRDTIKYEIGISAFGGYQVAGLVFNNVGTVSYSYVAVSNVLNYTVTDYDLIAEIIAKNSGTVTKAYFYDSSIKSCTSTEIVYRDNLFETNNYTTGKQLVGTYVSSTEALREAFESVTGWYTFNTYSSDVSSYLKTTLNTPIHRGIDISGTTGTISSTADYLYMYELFNIDDHFATDITYNITSDINLEDVPSNMYYYKRVISSTIQGLETKTGGSAVVTLSSGSTSTLPTIYNFNPVDPDRLVVTAGVDTYGLFPYISGTISNLNIIPSTSAIELTNLDSTSTNAKGIGALTGYSEKGSISNVNVYVDFKYSNNVDLGEYYLGGIAGLLGGEGEITSSTVNGIINISNISTSVTEDESTFTGGIAIGGAVGYVTDTYGSLSSILNTATISVTPNNTDTKYQVAGICGAGYLMTCTNLENRGTVTIGSSSVTPNYSNLYVSGVIGRLLGVTSEITNLTNQAAVTAYLYSSATINMVSGVLNADIVTLSSSNVLTASNTDGNLVVSAHKSSAGKYLFWASALSNAASVVVANAPTNLYYTDVINVYTANGFDSKLTGVYNLNYTNINNTKTYITATTIDMNVVSEYVPVVNVINGSNTTNYTTLKTVYNFKNLVFTNSSALSATNLIYGGVAKGSNINYTNVRNEGNIAFTFNYAITATLFKVFGVFDEVSAGCTADTIYNGGNITITSGSSVTSTITNSYISGICYKNNSNFTDTTYNEYNPLSSDFDYSLTGTLANVINNGDIVINQAGAKSNTVNNINGNIRVGGIVNINYSIISSAFNLGDITLNSYAAASKFLDVSGIATLCSGKYSQIKDCANNGTIKNLNMSTTNAFIVAAGIVARNDLNSSFNAAYTSNTNNPNSQGSIVFTINYGSVIAYSLREVAVSTSSNVHYSAAAGILGQGICNTINVVNYANIYGSEVIGGLISILNFGLYSGEVTESSPVYLANSINYGTTYVVAHRYSPSGIPKTMTYEYLEQVELAANNETYISYGILLIVTNAACYGSCIALIDYHSNSNAQYINIRYLINMNSVASMISYEIATPTSVTGATQTMFSAKQNDKYLNSSVVYAPLNNESTTAYIGLFSDDFVFRKAIEGQITFDTDTNPTDAFLTDYFQFVAYSKINENLLNSIGWTTIAYNDAAERFGENLTALTKLMADYDSISNTSYESLLSSAFNTSTWVSNCSPTILSNMLADVLNSQDLASLKAIISYLFFDSSYNSEITTTLRKTVVDTMVTYIDSNKTDGELVAVLDALMYPELLAKIIAESDTDYKAIKTIITENVSNLTTAQKLDLLNTYIDLLDNSSYYKELFDETSDYKAYYTSQKYKVLSELLGTLDTTMLGEIYNSLDTTSYSTSMALKYALDSMNDSQKRDLFYNIFYYSYSGLASTYEEAITSLLSQLDTTTKEDTYFTNNVASTFTTNYLTTDASYVDTWNAIKNNEAIQEYLSSRFGYVQDSTNNIHKGIYAIATEYRNSYQSNDAPSEATYEVNSDGSVTTSSPYLTISTSTDSSNKRVGIKNRFIYTPDAYVSDAYTYSTNGSGVKTYYYGPYANSPKVDSTTTGNSSTTPTTATMWNYKNTQGAPLKGYKLNANDNTSGVSVRYVPVFIGIDEDYMANLTGGTVGSSYYKFLWNNCGIKSAVYQWVSSEICTNKPDNNKYVLKKDTTNGRYSTSTNGTSASGTTYYYRYYTYDSNGNATSHSLSPSDTLYYNYSTVGKTTHYGDIYNGLCYNDVGNKSSSWSVDDVLWGYIASSVITGIYYQQNMWETYGAFLTCKTDKDVKLGVITTRYIDYSLSDLIAVDGIRTKGLSTGASDDDEITVIKNLMNNYLLDTDEGKLLVLKAVAEAMKTDVYSIDAARYFAYAMYANTNTTFINDFLENIAITPESYNLLCQSDYTTTVKAYLTNIYTTNVLPTLSNIDKIIMYSADSRTNMKMILKYFYDKDTGYYTYLSGLSDLYTVLNTYDTSEYQILYDFIKDNSSHSESELSSIISSAVDTYINNYVTDYNAANDLSSVSSLSLSGYSTSNASSELSSATYDDKYYSSKLVSTDGSSDYTVTFTPDTNSATSVVAAGSGTISDGTTSYTVSTTLTEYMFDTTAGTSTTITASSGVEIYSIDKYAGTANTGTLYSNLDINDWSYSTGSLTIGGVSFTSGYISSSTDGATFTFTLLEDASSITIYAYPDGTYTRTLYYTNTRYLQFSNTTAEAKELNLTNLTTTKGTQFTFRLYADRALYIYGIKVNDTMYTFAKNNSVVYAQQNGSYMYSSTVASGTLLSYDSSSFNVIGSTSTVAGNILKTTSSTQLISTGSAASYYTYSLSTIDTATYFANNYIKNAYSKLLTGISAYTSNEIELYIANKQYGDYMFTLDTNNAAAATYTQAVPFNKFTLNADSTHSITVGSASTSYGSVTFDQKIILASDSTASSGSISFTTTGAAKLYIVLKANTSTLGNILVSNGSTVVGSYINSGINTYEFALSSAGTYYIYSDCEVCIYTATAVLDTDLASLNTNYTNVATKGSTIISALEAKGYTSSNYATYTAYHNYLKRLNDVLEANTNTTTYFDNEIILLALTQTTDINLYNLFTNDVIIQLLKQSGYKLDEVFGNATSSTSSGLLSYIDASTAKTIITTLANASDNLLAEAIIKATLDSTTVTNASTLERELVAAYVSTDFLTRLDNNTLTSSYMDDIIEALTSNKSVDYDFIVSDDDISTKQFLKLMQYLGVDVATDGYGIFALASSHGIENGTFIPDNINLIDMDANYSKLDGTSIIELTDEASSSWRDLTGSSTSSSYDVTKTDSVNYHVREEMKQLKLSISTSVFELDLVYNSTYNIYASQTQIDTSNNTITYQVSPTMYDNIKSMTSMTIAKIEIAESASYTSNLSSITWKEDTDNSTLKFADALVVTAEDTTVSTSYTIVIKSTTISYDLEYYSTTYTQNGTTTTTRDSMNIPYYGATVTFKFTGTNFAEGLDLKNYFYVGSTKAKTSAYATPTYWKFTSGASNNGIVDSNGVAYISVDVTQAMPQGTKYFTLMFYGATAALRKSVSITKNANTAAEITAFAYDGTDLLSTITGSSKKATSSILFGRAFTYTELTDYNSDSFYLYDFAVSDNATVLITATKTESNGLMTYTVTYVVTSESGGVTNTYTHTLTEVSPYATNDVYAYLYRDGYTHTPYTESFEGQPSTGTSSLTYTSGVSNYAAVYFNRGYDYQYRIRYVLNNFYITNRDSNFGASEATQNNGSSILESYGGLTVSVTKSQDPGTYTFEYVYTNTGEWSTPAVYLNAEEENLTYDSTVTYYMLYDGIYQTLESLDVELDEDIFNEYRSELYILSGGGTETYTRTYTFPTLYVIKDYAIDALVSRLTFLDESIVLGDTATVMAPSHPLIPTDSDGNVYDANYDQVGSVSANSGVEWTYNDAFSNNTGVTISTTTVNYTSAAADASVTDYYALGTVSDSDLTYYSPTVTIDDYAQIYKYTTLTKLTNYGTDVPDKSILTDHTSRFIYVPFDYTIGTTTTTVVFLVQLEDGTNNWTNVYTTAYDGEDETQLVYTYTTTITTANAKEAASGFTVDGKDYTISSLAGTTASDNISLYMDYIGNPAEGHFWYISYAVFSEYYLQNGITDTNGDGEDDLGAVKYYHISIIDATNTIYFEVQLYAPTDFEIDEVYLTISENIYDTENALTSSRQISAYAVQDYEYTEVSLDSSSYQSGKYYIQNRDGTYSLSTDSYSSDETYYERGSLSISNKYDSVDISTMTQAIFEAGEYYTYTAYTAVTITSTEFAAGTYYTYSDYKAVSITSGMFVTNTYYIYSNGTYTLATEYVDGTQYYKKTPTYTVATEYDSTETYYEKTDTYTLATTYVEGTQYYKKSATYGLVKYTLRYTLATLPKGYFYFYLDLPTGYVAKCVTDMENQLSKQTSTVSGTSTTLADEEAGSFVPYTSILTQTVNLEIIVSKGSGADASAWAVSTSDLYTRQIEYVGSSWDEE